ncbi:MAG TPA: hypothetical protein VF528_03980 [Pyrinomonadaceae bacterium]
MLSRPRKVWISTKGIARIFAVALLTFVLLSGLIPAGALTATHACRMDCCAAKPPHETGACNAVPPSTQPIETTKDADTDEHPSHHERMEMNVTVRETVTETDASSHHCQTAKHSSAQRQAPHRAQTHNETASSATARAFDKPCSAECAAGVLTLTQGRRPRESAAHSIAARPRPPTLAACPGSFNILLSSSTEHGRQSSPRGPPAPLVEFYA